MLLVGKHRYLIFGLRYHTFLFNPRNMSYTPAGMVPAPATTQSPTAKKDSKRLEKEAKLAAKVSKAASTPAGEKKVKGEKGKRDAEPEFVNTTPPGKKKGTCYFMSHILSC